MLASKPEKLYLEVVALEVAAGTQPITAREEGGAQTGESLIGSADERFLLSYGSARAIKILLNGQELTVNEPKTPWSETSPSLQPVL